MLAAKKRTPKIELCLVLRDQTTPLTASGRATRASNFGRGNTQAKRLREGSATNSLKLVDLNRVWAWGAQGLFPIRILNEIY